METIVGQIIMQLKYKITDNILSKVKNSFTSKT